MSKFFLIPMLYNFRFYDDSLKKEFYEVAIWSIKSKSKDFTTYSQKLISYRPAFSKISSKIEFYGLTTSNETNFRKALTSDFVRRTYESFISALCTNSCTVLYQKKGDRWVVQHVFHRRFLYLCKGGVHKLRWKCFAHYWPSNRILLLL